jgi:hypothetical protein
MLITEADPTSLFWILRATRVPSLSHHPSLDVNGPPISPLALNPPRPLLLPSLTTPLPALRSPPSTAINDHKVTLPAALTPPPTIRTTIRSLPRQPKERPPSHLPDSTGNQPPNRRSSLSLSLPPLNLRILPHYRQQPLLQPELLPRGER